MPKPQSMSNAEENHSPEFKLRAVLEYVRSPKRKNQICQEYRIGEELLVQWHQEFLAGASQIFSGSMNSPAQSQSASQEIGATDSLKVDSRVSPTELSWGIRLNKGTYGSFHPPSCSTKPPSWLPKSYQEEWINERGVLIWDEHMRKLEDLSAGEALRLLAKLRKNDEWRKEGITITRLVTLLDVSEDPKQKRSGKKEKAEADLALQQKQPKPELVEEERFRLKVEVGDEVFAFLEKHEALLREMAEEDDKHRRKVLGQVYTMILGWVQTDEENKIDLAKRTLPWLRRAESHTWVCDMPPNRGTVVLDKSNLCWSSFIERPNRFKHDSPFFPDLEEALRWTEQELLTIQNEGTEATEKQTLAKTEMVTVSNKSRIDLTPYRIDPGVLEPEQVTYRVLIDLTHQPEHFKTMEMSFGKLWRYDEEFPGPMRVAGELGISDIVATIEQPAGPNYGYNLIHSTAIYYQAQIATTQAQHLWDASGIQRLYKEGKITQARYGIEEVETQYCTWLGGLEDPEQPWRSPRTREQHMADWALEQTLAYALDVDGFRERLHLSPNLITDDKILDILHHRRAQSKHIPVAARTESEQWIKRHSE
ncbi:MAG: transposase [Nitrospirae bacterium]|nr:transposase [Nitrospirota bacterium]